MARKLIDIKSQLAQFIAESKPIPEPTHKNENVLIIDAMNLYCRAFAVSNAMDSDGQHVGGMSGFLKSIGAAIRMHRPSRCILIFDGAGGSTRRRSIYKEYKGNRKPMSKLNRTYDFNSIEEEVESRKKQLVQLVNILEDLPVTVLAIDNIEADDAIAYLTKIVVEEHAGKVCIMSTDKDFLQLVSEDVTVYNSAKKKVYTPEEVVVDYGIHPVNFVIYRVLDGDASDNIPGIKGMGLKTLLKHFPELAESTEISWSQVYEKCNGIKAVVMQTLLESKDIVTRNESLMRLSGEQMSGHAKLKALGMFNANISKLDTHQLLTKINLVGMRNTFRDINDWVRTTFTQLNRFAE